MDVGYVVTEDRDGADLRVSVGGKETEAIEVKGTATDEIAWAKLKVSSLQSYRALKTRTGRMYRVVNVGERQTAYLHSGVRNPLRLGTGATLGRQSRLKTSEELPAERNSVPVRSSL